MSLNSELLAALIFLVFGAVAVASGLGYGTGTARMLGAGALPSLAGAGLILLGILQGLRALRAGPGLPAAFSRSELRPLAAILGAVIAFGVLIPPVGMVPALCALIAISWFGDSRGSRIELLVLMAVSAVLIVSIFHWGLGLPFRLFDWKF